MSDLLLGLVVSICTSWFHNMYTLPSRLVGLILVHRHNSLHCLILLSFIWMFIIIIIIGTRRHRFYPERCLQRIVALKWWIRRIIPPTSINGNVLRHSHNVRLKYQYYKDGCSTFLINWQPNAETQNVGTTQLTILNITHFELVFQIIEKSNNKILYNPQFTEGWVELINRFYNHSS